MIPTKNSLNIPLKNLYELLLFGGKMVWIACENLSYLPSPLLIMNSYS